MRRAYRQKSSAVTAVIAEATEALGHSLPKEKVLNDPEHLAGVAALPPTAHWDDASPLARSFDAALSPPLTRELYGLLDAQEDAILLIDGTGQILFRNQAAASLVDDAAGLRPSSLLHCEGELWRAALELLSDGLAGRSLIERQIMNQQPSKFWRLRLQELQNSVGGARRFALRLRDVTEQTRLLQNLKLNQSMARSGLLLAGAAHQAKNLLFGLSATLQAMQAAHSMDIDEHEPYLANLKDGIERMQAMVRNVFAQSRPRANCTALSASVIASEAIQGCMQLAVQRKVNICLGVSSDARVWGERQQLIQALENLIDNAVRYAPATSTVTVDVDQVSDEEGGARIRIADHGTGFQPQDANQLFTPFFTRRPGGTGLGLTVARHIIEEHAGKIVLTNAETGGALVTLLLPLPAPRSTLIAQTTRPAELWPASCWLTMIPSFASRSAAFWKRMAALSAKQEVAQLRAPNWKRHRLMPLWLTSRCLTAMAWMSCEQCASTIRRSRLSSLLARAALNWLSVPCRKGLATF